jgi:hypothetical protein
MYQEQERLFGTAFYDVSKKYPNACLIATIAKRHNDSVGIGFSVYTVVLTIPV